MKGLMMNYPLTTRWQASDEELIEFLSRDFAKYQLPTSYVVINEVPKTSVGKFDKKELRRLCSEGKL